MSLTTCLNASTRTPMGRLVLWIEARESAVNYPPTPRQSVTSGWIGANAVVKQCCWHSVAIIIGVATFQTAQMLPDFSGKKKSPTRSVYNVARRGQKCVKIIVGKIQSTRQIQQLLPSPTFIRFHLWTPALFRQYKVQDKSNNFCRLPHLSDFIFELLPYPGCPIFQKK